MGRARSLHQSFAVIILLFAVFNSAPAAATKLGLSGGWSYQYSGSTAEMTVGGISNLASSGTSGSLRLELWAFGSPFKGARQLGYRLATYRVDPLSAGTAYANVSSGSVAFDQPPQGRWHISLSVAEWDGSDWRTRYYILSDSDQLMLCTDSDCEVVIADSGATTVIISTSRPAYTVDSEDTLSLSAEIVAGNDTGVLADAYITASLDLGTPFYLDANLQWVSSISAAASNFPLASLSVPNFFGLPITGLGQGNYQFSLLLSVAGQNPAIAANQIAYNAVTTTFKAANADGSGISFTPGVNPFARVDSYYAFDFYPFVSGGLAPYYFKLGTAGGFPPMGLVLAPNGILSGTPSIETSATFVVCAVDLGADSSCKTVTVSVTDSGDPPLGDPTDPDPDPGPDPDPIPDGEALSLTIDSATCSVGERFSWGTIIYDVINASGSASGPEGSFINGVQCSAWTDCERGQGEPASTTWTYQSDTYVGTPQSFSVTLTGLGDSLFDSRILNCPTQ